MPDLRTYVVHLRDKICLVSKAITNVYVTISFGWRLQLINRITHSQKNALSKLKLIQPVSNGFYHLIVVAIKEMIAGDLDLTIVFVAGLFSCR